MVDFVHKKIAKQHYPLTTVKNIAFCIGLFPTQELEDMFPESRKVNMNELINNIRLVVKDFDNFDLLELSKAINLEVFNRHNNNLLKGCFKPGDQLTFSDDDGCLLFGEIASSEEIRLPDEYSIYIKGIDQKTKMDIVEIGPNGKLLPVGVPMFNESQLFKYILSTEDVSYEL